MGPCTFAVLLSAFPLISSVIVSHTLPRFQIGEPAETFCFLARCGPLNRAGIPGLEPRMTVPETVVLPITPYPNDAFGPVSQDQSCAPSASARVITLPESFAAHKSREEASPAPLREQASAELSRNGPETPCRCKENKDPPGRLPLSRHLSSTPLAF